MPLAVQKNLRAIRRARAQPLDKCRSLSIAVSPCQSGTTSNPGTTPRVSHNFHSAWMRGASAGVTS